LGKPTLKFGMPGKDGEEPADGICKPPVKPGRDIPARPGIGVIPVTPATLVMPGICVIPGMRGTAMPAMPGICWRFGIG